MTCVVCLLPSTALVPAGCCGQVACRPCLGVWFETAGGPVCVVCRAHYERVFIFHSAVLFWKPAVVMAVLVWLDCFRLAYLLFHYIVVREFQFVSLVALYPYVPWKELFFACIFLAYADIIVVLGSCLLRNRDFGKADVVLLCDVSHMLFVTGCVFAFWVDWTRLFSPNPTPTAACCPFLPLFVAVSARFAHGRREVQFLLVLVMSEVVRQLMK
jgi:hypothetical protein